MPQGEARRRGRPQLVLVLVLDSPATSGSARHVTAEWCVWGPSTIATTITSTISSTSTSTSTISRRTFGCRFDGPSPSGPIRSRTPRSLPPLNGGEGQGGRPPAHQQNTSNPSSPHRYYPLHRQPGNPSEDPYFPYPYESRTEHPVLPPSAPLRTAGELPVRRAPVHRARRRRQCPRVDGPDGSGRRSVPRTHAGRNVRLTAERPHRQERRGFARRSGPPAFFVVGGNRNPSTQEHEHREAAVPCRAPVGPA